jgi:hypothetical protein
MSFVWRLCMAVETASVPPAAYSNFKLILAAGGS